MRIHDQVGSFYHACKQGSPWDMYAHLPTSRYESPESFKQRFDRLGSRGGAVVADAVVVDLNSFLVRITGSPTTDQQFELLQRVNFFSGIDNLNKRIAPMIPPEIIRYEPDLF